MEWSEYVVVIKTSTLEPEKKNVLEFQLWNLHKASHDGLNKNGPYGSYIWMVGTQLVKLLGETLGDVVLLEAMCQWE